ncbi:hypothetical protein AVEN_203001-1 [Araneus ventricosus]|uniref:Uncharacterized protein n=1 Tax=Araneus ventricosus TaxID=182803 RepID=A0A4Y2EMB3_ARAVE|nr:hypothetical protein AVEN_203001-1 [Araneus ventricosus]
MNRLVEDSQVEAVQKTALESSKFAQCTTAKRRSEGENQCFLSSFSLCSTEYYTVTKAPREYPVQKKGAREQSFISQDTEASIKEKEPYEKSRYFDSLGGFDLKISSLELSSL